MKKDIKKDEKRFTEGAGTPLKSAPKLRNRPKAPKKSK